MLHRLTAAAAFALAACAIPAQAAGNFAEITVTGQASVTQPPDVATLNATVMTNSDKAQGATSQNQRAYDRLVSAMHALKIPESDIKTDYLNVNFNPRPSPQPQGPNAVEPPPDGTVYGYIVNRGVTVTMHDTKIVGKAVDAAVAAGVTNIGGVSFAAEHTGGAYSQAVQMAVRDARNQADAMAAAARLHVVRIKTMQQGALEQPPQPVPFAPQLKTMASVPTRIPPSDVRVYATVTITYEASP
ncbi:MAG TPA: SIMPL domain-containing protein [Candidatus Baltobacteraceae bacterium]|jgi:hypothetical protein